MRALGFHLRKPFGDADHAVVGELKEHVRNSYFANASGQCDGSDISLGCHGTFSVSILVCSVASTCETTSRHRRPRCGA